MQRTSSLLISLAAISGVLLGAAGVRADHQFCGTDTPANAIAWTGTSRALVVDPGGWPQGSAWFGDVLVEVNALNAFSSFDFSLTVGDGSWQGGRNDLLFWAGPDTTFPTALAVTNVWYENICGSTTPPCCVGTDPSNIVETDLIFFANNNAGPINWVSGPQTRLVNVTNFNQTIVTERITLLHEMLHAVGLNHTTSATTIGQSRITAFYPAAGWWDDGSIDVLGPDVGDLRALYGGTSSGTGVLYGSNLQATGNSMFIVPLSWDPPGSGTADVFPRNRTPIAGQPNNRVRRGQTMDFRVCVGSRANAAQAVTMNVWVSTDATLSETADIRVAQIPFNFPGFSSGCSQQSFTIPNTVPNGTFNVIYRLGDVSNGTNLSARTVIINRQIVVVP